MRWSQIALSITIILIEEFQISNGDKYTMLHKQSQTLHTDPFDHKTRYS